MSTKSVTGAGQSLGAQTLNPLATPAGAPKTDDASKAAPAALVPKAAVGDTATSANKNPAAANVQISSSAKERAEAYQKALGIARATPDVREDRVAALKKQIQDGTYQADSGKIADSMLREAIKEHLAETDR